MTHYVKHLTRGDSLKVDEFSGKKPGLATFLMGLRTVIPSSLHIRLFVLIQLEEQYIATP